MSCNILLLRITGDFKIFFNKEIDMKFIYLFLGLFLIGCGASSSQFVFYETEQEETPWRVSVVQNSDEFECRINDFDVMTGTFSAFSNSFEIEKLFRAKSVLMSGYREVHEHNNRYYVRIFIDKKEVAKFDF
jgi:hypothetical protein